MRWLLLVGLLLCAVEARADAVIGIARPANATVEHAKLDVWLHPDRAAVRMTLVVSGSDDQPRDPEIVLDLPADARVTALTMETLELDPATATAMQPAQARVEYGKSRSRSALFEAAGARYRLGVAAVTRARPTTVVLAFSFPRRDRAIALVPAGFTVGRLEIAVSGDGVKERSQSWNGVSTRRVIALLTPPRTLAEPIVIGNAVDATTSLLAITKARPVLGPTIMIPAPQPSDECCLCRSPIRKYIKLRIPRLRHCYERELQRTPTLAGTVELQFTLGTDGASTPAPQFGGTLVNAKVHACLRQEIATWKLGPEKTAILVNYPLTFRPSP